MRRTSILHASGSSRPGARGAPERPSLSSRPARAAAAGGLLALGVLSVGGCAGGGPLLHPAKTLDAGSVRAAGGMSGNAATLGLASGLRAARSEAKPGPAGSGPPDETYARGALVAAAIAPGLAPHVAARVGLGNAFEAGLAYTGRGARVDGRRSFDRGNVSLSVGAGAFGAFAGASDRAAALPGVSLQSLRGYGVDLPVLVGWESVDGIYMAWAGVRGGYEHDTIEVLSTEPTRAALAASLTPLTADRLWAGGLVGVAGGFRHLHVALEVDVSYQHLQGTFGGTAATLDGLTVNPGGAVLWDF